MSDENTFIGIGQKMIKPMKSDENKYCCNCDYAISFLEWESIVADVECPRCKQTRISDFYSFGSFTHIKRYRDYLSGKVRGNPPSIELKEIYKLQTNLQNSNRNLKP